MKGEIKNREKFFKIHAIQSIDALLTEIEKGLCPQFLFFWKHYPQQENLIDKSCLSQWWHSPFVYSQEKYQTAEHFMMAQKALLFEDYETFRNILAAPTPKEAKRLGRTVKGFDEAIWEEKRFNIVLRGNLAKFSQNKRLEEYLLNTSDYILVEASPYDPIWGIGLAEEDPRAKNPKEWQGLNILGFALMQARLWLHD